ncbi:MAG: polymer-forming cytoskeletal protein [Maricaulaceae bacterium]|nr:polymer-forming cytoskeletal protein [Maricaulaceae bacterium]
MFFRFISACAVLISMAAAPAAAQMIGGDITLRDQNREGDLRVIAGDFTYTGRLGGDLSVIGGDITVDAVIGGSASIVGGNVELSGETGRGLHVASGVAEIDASIGGDADIAAGVIRVRGAVVGDLKAAGAVVTVGETAHIGGRLHGAGERLSIAGRVEGGARIRAEEVTVSGVIRGDIDAEANSFTIAPGGRIEGALRLRGAAAPVIAEGAEVTGEIDYAYADVFRHARGMRDINVRIPFMPSIRALSVPITFSAFLLGLLACLVAPRGVARIASEFRRRPFASGVVGLAVFAFSPVLLVALVVLLAITVIGVFLIPVLVIGWPLMLFLSFAFGGVAVGDLIFNRRPETPLGLGLRAVSLLVVLVAVAALGVSPFLGFTAGLILMCIGLGAWIFAMGKRNGAAASEPAPAPAAA